MFITISLQDVINNLVHQFLIGFIIEIYNLNEDIPKRVEQKFQESLEAMFVQADAQ